jgi:ribosomal protein S18 acetylase RimI-like enzyme
VILTSAVGSGETNMGPNGERRRTPQMETGPPGSAGPGRARSGSGRNAPEVRIRPATGADDRVCAALHAGQISQGFLSLLGPGFLRRLYGRIRRSPYSFLLVATRGQATVGFVAASTDVARLYRSFLWHDGIPAALRAAGPLLSGWRRVIDTLGHASSGGVGVGRGPELLSIAVDPAWQGHGAGRMLVTAFLDEVGARGHGAAHVVVGADNAPAVSLYQQAGFVAVERFELHRGTESLLMQWDRHPPGPATGTAHP